MRSQICLHQPLRTLETVDRLEIGLLFAGDDLSRPAFFSSGSTCANLYRAGNIPACSDRLASLAMAGVKTSAQSLSSKHGRTSSGDVLQDLMSSTNLFLVHMLEQGFTA